MTTRTRRTTRTTLAIVTAYLALIVGSLLSAAPVWAQVPPPEAVPPATVHHVASVSGAGSATWQTYVLVAFVAVAVGMALSYGLARLRVIRAATGKTSTSAPA